MDDQQQNTAAWFAVRPACAGDYAAFVRLFPELQVDDPIPSSQAWASVLVPGSWVATADEKVVGYCYVQEYEDTGYVRNVVVAPRARGRGVGRALMQVIAERLRASGKRFWRLNVTPDNHAALALYRRMGLRIQYPATALRLPWTILGSLPAGRVVARDLSPTGDADLETRFDLPRGQLAHARGLGRLVFETVAPDQTATGLAVFDPNFPRAFPFRVVETQYVAPLLQAMRTHVPHHEFVDVVVEDDARLVAMFTSLGATVRDEIQHLKARL